jgi:hypothetical protein
MSPEATNGSGTGATKSHDTAVVAMEAPTHFVGVNLVVWRTKKNIPTRTVLVNHVAKNPRPIHQTDRTSILSTVTF